LLLLLGLLEISLPELVVLLLSIVVEPVLGLIEASTLLLLLLLPELALWLIKCSCWGYTTGASQENICLRVRGVVAGKSRSSGVLSSRTGHVSDLSTLLELGPSSTATKLLPWLLVTLLLVALLLPLLAKLIISKLLLLLMLLMVLLMLLLLRAILLRLLSKLLATSMMALLLSAKIAALLVLMLLLLLEADTSTVTPTTASTHTR
jgi:hypothetical protein